MDIRLIGLGTANPPLRLAQEEVYQAYVDLLPLSETARGLLHKFLIEEKSIAFRHFGMDRIADALQDSQDQLIARYEKFAVPTAVEAAQRALAEAGLAASEVDAIVANTCTGYLCPGLTSYVSQALGLRPEVRPFDLMGMGCGGALPALETGYNYLCANKDGYVLTLSVEICTATIYFCEEPGILVSNSIFGDGAAATVLTNRPGGEGILLRGFASGLFPEHREKLRYVTANSRLKNSLSPRVPFLGARHSQEVVGRLLAAEDLSAQNIDHWMVHPGGRKVLDVFESALDLPTDALAPSRTVLYSYGNMSSPSVLFVLQEVRQNHAPRPGSLGMLCSFGAGFAAFAGLVEFTA